MTSVENWPADRIVSLDVETTGIDPATDRIVEIALVVGHDRMVVERKSWLIDPGVDIPAEASAVHGITTERVRKEGRPFADIVFDLDAMIVRTSGAPLRVRPPPVVAAYNAPFDRAFVQAEWARAEVPETDWLHHVTGWLDPLVWAKEAQKYEKSKKLGAVAERLGIPIVGVAHRATADAETALRVLYELRRPSAWADWSRRTGQDVRAFFPAELEECIAAQERIRANQDADFRAWLARQPPNEAATAKEGVA